MRKKKILCVIGTRPEVIKMASLILLLREDPEVDLSVLAVAQHREMLDQMMKTFQIQATHDLNIMQANQTLPQLTARLPVLLDEFLEKTGPDMVIAQGDTTTTFMTSLACFYRKVPFLHIEAGLRSGNRSHPFPEEMNRVLISHLAALHFAPTEEARENLLKEGIAPDRIFVTGNTVVDALQHIIRNSGNQEPASQDLRLLLVTAHRRENIGPPLVHICQALKTIVRNNQKVQVLFPVHPNPNVSKIVHGELQGHPRITLCDPLTYEAFVPKMKQAYLILTDSGGVQEEAVSIGKPVLVMREVTDRPEGVKIGACLIAGTTYDSIVNHTQRLLDDPQAYQKMVASQSPYGDGNAAPRIASIIKSWK